jgi:hypothetical protein
MDRPQLEAAVRRANEGLERLTVPGVKLTGPRLLERMKEYAERNRNSEPQHRAARQEADLLVSELLALYAGGSDTDREWVRALLRKCGTFRWAAGWPVARPPPPFTPAQGLQALALLSMKDGGGDPRDQWVSVQRLCTDARKSGLDVPALLRQAAEWSSDMARFPPAPSTRALLLQFAERYT